MVDELNKKRMVPKPQYQQKPTLPKKPERGAFDNLNEPLGGASQPPMEQGEEEPEEEEGEEEPEEEEEGGEKPEEGAGKPGGKPPGKAGQKPEGSSNIDKAKQFALGSAGKKEAIKQELYDAAIKKLAMAGPWGRAAAIVLQAVPYIKKYGKYIVIFVLGCIFLAVSIISCHYLERGRGGSAFKDPVNMLSTLPNLMKVLAYGGKDEVATFTKDVVDRQNQTIDKIKNMINKENPEVRGASQKAKVLSLLDQYLAKLNHLRDLVSQIQAQELNIKPEENLTEDEYNKRNDQQNSINSTYSELENLMAQLELELNKCDRLGDKTPNDKGFFHLDDSANYEKFASTSYSADMDPYYLRGIPYCAALYIAQEFQNKTGYKLYLGEGSLKDGGPISYFQNRGHLDGNTFIVTGPGLARNSQELFGVNYKQDLAKWFAQLLYTSGAGLVYFNDSTINKMTTTNIAGDKVPLASSDVGVDDHWSVSYSFPDVQ